MAAEDAVFFGPTIEPARPASRRTVCMKKRLLWATLLVLVLAAGGAAYFVMRPSASADVTGGTATVERVAHEVLVRSQGLIVAATTIEVKSRASGLVQAVHATAGDRVRTGQVLLEVDPARSRLNEEEMRNQVEEARSQVRLAEESIDPDRVALAQRKLARARELSKEGLTTREAIEQAEYDAAAAERTVRNQRQQLEAAQRRLEIALTRLRRSEIESTFTVIRSPIDGVVLSRAVETGSGVTSFSDSAQGGTVLFKIGSLDRLAFDGNLAVSDLTKIKPGLAARVTSDAWREPAAGVVSYVAQEAVAPTQSSPNRAPTFQVKVELEGVHKDLPLNVPATAEIVVETCPTRCSCRIRACVTSPMARGRFVSQRTGRFASARSSWVPSPQEKSRSSAMWPKGRASSAAVARLRTPLARWWSGNGIPPRGALGARRPAPAAVSGHLRRGGRCRLDGVSGRRRLRHPPQSAGRIPHARCGPSRSQRAAADLHVDPAITASASDGHGRRCART